MLVQRFSDHDKLPVSYLETCPRSVGGCKGVRNVLRFLVNVLNFEFGGGVVCQEWVGLRTTFRAVMSSF